MGSMARVAAGASAALGMATEEEEEEVVGGAVVMTGGTAIRKGSCWV